MSYLSFLVAKETDIKIQSVKERPEGWKDRRDGKG